MRKPEVIDLKWQQLPEQFRTIPTIFEHELECLRSSSDRSDCLAQQPKVLGPETITIDLQLKFEAY